VAVPIFKPKNEITDAVVVPTPEPAVSYLDKVLALAERDAIPEAVLLDWMYASGFLEEGKLVGDAKPEALKLIHEGWEGYSPIMRGAS
jgi:hypothetical protein